MTDNPLRFLMPTPPEGYRWKTDVLVGDENGPLVQVTLEPETGPKVDPLWWTHPGRFCEPTEEAIIQTAQEIMDKRQEVLEKRAAEEQKKEATRAEFEHLIL